MAAHRRSALLLHGLVEPDRRWVLGHLAEEDQRILERHLIELRQLGIPADPSLRDSIRSDSPTVADDPLRTASAARMQALLVSEPAWLVRHVLTLEDWPWRQDFVATLAPGRQRLMASQVAPLSRKVAERLRWHLAHRLTVAPSGIAESQPDRPTRGHLFCAVRRWVRQWR